MIQGIWSLKQAIDIVARQNNYTTTKQAEMLTVAQLVYKYIPLDVQHLCSYYMVQDHRYLNYKITNYWILACPMYDRDCALLWLDGVPSPSTVSDSMSRQRYQFARVNSVLLAMDYDEVLNMKEDDWQFFQGACIETARRKDRMWVSNIHFDE